MYSIIKAVINGGNFELNDILNKIDTMWVRSSITEEQRTELMELARSKAKPEASYAPLQEQIDTLAERIEDQEARISVLENNKQGEETPVEPEDEWPLYQQPTGAHDSYNVGDKITYNGKHYICKMNGCVWTPDAYPAGWELQAEQDVDDSETAL